MDNLLCRLDTPNFIQVQQVVWKVKHASRWKDKQNHYIMHSLCKLSAKNGRYKYELRRLRERQKHIHEPKAN